MARVAGVEGVREEPGAEDQPLDVSVVMPCLNEAETLGACIDEALAAIRAGGLSGEVIVADNGSTDGSAEIAATHGARVVRVTTRGYGAALRGGIESARGRYVVMGDADGSYDFSSVPAFVERLRDGYDLVVGNRFQGGILPGAMPWLHRRLGNPVLSSLGRLFFRAPVRDFHCGLRGFSVDAYSRLRLRSPGMEFASEMIVTAQLAGQAITEIPTVLRKDGRSRRPHLRTWRDGWRHLRFMLLFSPRWLFLGPGLLLFLAGLAIVVWLLPGTRQVGTLGLDIHTMLVGSAAAMVGFQIVVFALFAEIFAVHEGLRPEPPALTGLFRYIRLETGLAVGLLVLAAGITGLGVAFWRWESTGFRGLDPRQTMRVAIPAVMLMALGTQTIFASFFLSILGMRSTQNA